MYLPVDYVDYMQNYSRATTGLNWTAEAPLSKNLLAELRIMQQHRRTIQISRRNILIAAMAKTLLLIALLLICAAALLGCSLYDAQPPKEQDEPPQETIINIGKDKTAPAVAATTENYTANLAAENHVINVNPPTILPAPIITDSPELTNVNRYARALEEKLLRRYNNTPAFAGKIGKVQVLPNGEPKQSLNGDKLKIEWSQIVFDIWGDRVPELEKEFFVVVFGDGKPAMQRTRPTITVGLNNEGGYSETAVVRGGILSEHSTPGDPTRFDRPDSERTTLLDDNLAAKNSASAAYNFYDIDSLRDHSEKTERIAAQRQAAIPVIKPAPENLTALLANE